MGGTAGRRKIMANELADKTILLVDDDRDIRATMKATLEQLGAKILLAADGNEAVEQAEKNSPHLIVLDMMLPKRSGFLVMEKLKRGKGPGDPPRIIMITGNPGTRHKAYAKSLGVDEYFNKPFPMDRLVETIKKLLT